MNSKIIIRWSTRVFISFFSDDYFKTAANLYTSTSYLPGSSSTNPLPSRITPSSLQDAVAQTGTNLPTTLDPPGVKHSTPYSSSHQSSHFLSPRHDTFQNNVNVWNSTLGSAHASGGPFPDTAAQRASLFDMFAAASSHSYSNPCMTSGFKGHEGHQMFYSGAMNALRYHPAAGLALAASKKKGD